MSGLLLKVGLYGIIRVFTLMFHGYQQIFQSFFLLLSIITIIFGAFGALAQNDIKRLLAYSSISQIGYILFGIALFSQFGISSAIFYIVCHSVIKSLLFLVAGTFKKLTGTLEMDKMGGVMKTHPFISFSFLIGALSLAGLPPLNGFCTLILAIFLARGEKIFH